jgi:hypothetical protein
MKLTLKDATDLFGEDEEHKRYFSMVYSDMAKSDTDDLQEYLDYVRDNFKEWLGRVPETMKALSSLAKAKTAVMEVLDHVEVRFQYGPWYCNKARKEISDMWKAYSEAEVIWRERVGKVKAGEWPLEESLKDVKARHEGEDGLIFSVLFALNERDRVLYDKVMERWSRYRFDNYKLHEDETDKKENNNLASVYRMMEA